MGITGQWEDEMVWSMPRWETTVIMIEWLSAFLLAVEAIKLENFEAIDRKSVV